MRWGITPQALGGGFSQYSCTVLQCIVCGFYFHPMLSTGYLTVFTFGSCFGIDVNAVASLEPCSDLN